ncbi:MAG: uroporphyrinogen-III synthase [Sphingomicrobium sp.]
MKRVLVLRPQPGASITAREARELGLEAVIAPLFEIRPLDWRPPNPAQFDGLLLTSANAVRHGGPGLLALRGLPVFAVGGSTAGSARHAGFAIAATGAAGIEELTRAIDPGLRLLHLCGADRRDPVTPGLPSEAIAVYCAEAVAAPDLSAAAGSVALIHSPRAGQRFAELVGDRSTITIAAISAAAADAAGSGWETVATAPQPNDAALLALAVRLCNTPAPQ